MSFRYSEISFQASKVLADIATIGHRYRQGMVDIADGNVALYLEVLPESSGTAYSATASAG